VNNSHKIEERVPSVELIPDSEPVHQSNTNQVVKTEKPAKSAMSTQRETDVCDFNRPGKNCVVF